MMDYSLISLETFYSYLHIAHNSLEKTNVKQIRTARYAFEALNCIPFPKLIDEFYISQIADGIVCFSGMIEFQDDATMEITIELNLEDCNDLSINRPRDSAIDIISIIGHKDIPLSICFHEDDYLFYRWVYKMDLNYVPLLEYEK